jgi:hypothetical protein
VLATVELAWKLDLDSLRDGEQFWLVGEAATSAMIRQICESHDVSGGAVLAVAGGPNGDTPALPDDLESDVRHLLQTLQAGSVGSYFGDDPLRTRFGAFKRPGCSEFVDTYFADTPRTDVDYQPTLRWCRELLSGSTRHVNHAAVYSPTNRLGRGSSRGPGAPGEPDPIFHSASALGRDFWMLEHWLPDVTPIQIVTAHHLDRLGGRLAGWSVGELGDDRYLLEADDALAWFTDPSSERYEIAYREFEPAILKRADARSIRLAQYELWGL